MIKKLLIFLVILSIAIPYADAAPLSDKTGLKFTFPVKTDGQTFVVGRRMQVQSMVQFYKSIDQKPVPAKC